MKFLFLLSLLVFSIPAQPDDDFARNLVAFNKPYAVFARRYAGCPDDAKDLSVCVPGMGRLDQKLYEQSREAAKKLFDLEDRGK
jgi:hypothetical protein